jgi:hypothetical protein
MGIPLLQESSCMDKGAYLVGDNEVTFKYWSTIKQKSYLPLECREKCPEHVIQTHTHKLVGISCFKQVQYGLKGPWHLSW